VSDIAGVIKCEVVIDKTEIAFSSWGKKNCKPVFGLDYSFKILGLRISGETAASKGRNVKSVEICENKIQENNRERSSVWSSINVGRGFDWSGQSNRLRISAEYFYNGSGYKKNILNDTAVYDYDIPKNVRMGDSTITVTRGTISDYLLSSELFEPNYFSRHYAALFVAINKFFIPELTLTMNCISNISQKSFILSPGLTYSDIHGFEMGFDCEIHAGKARTEYTIDNNRAILMLRAGITF